MSKVVQVKKLKIGEGMPKICVSITGNTDEKILEEARELKNVKLDIVEWRVDFYKYVDNIEKVKDILIKLSEVLIDIPLIFTFRSKNEGGEREILSEYYTKLNCEIAKTKLVDLIDVELFVGDDYINKIIEFSHQYGVKVILSNHDFSKTPSKKEIIFRLTKMIKLDADLAKIAVMPQNTGDVLTLLCATNEMKEKYPDNPIITMSMNGIGVISRLAGEIFGSCLTFGATEKASAPGQIKVEDLYSILKVLHNNK
ncbi:type I 3-dehydroquinate dehydratase [Clostridium weizhouense]|uniref:3-dehydroquinate dehydratase n=1 Tax=Clostridium weizhouense TaxID=2859781 RepID=A0ABS7APR4_9CLOT|nr:type I 3-dehydroquinate dehydratase [Clostridium weizhouense]MBW6410607.1 type I 3-dehydroquinate dehydratase [Clostridium weizhouense]